MITLVKVEKNEEEVLHNLMQFYIYEFAAIKPGILLEADGTYKRFNLEAYFSSSSQHSFFIKFENELIGFALVSTECGSQPNSIEEFHIIRKYSGRGYGKEAALKLFERFPGRWQITQIEPNTSAQAFWQKVIGQYTGGSYSEYIDQFKRTVQEFVSVPVSS